MSSLAESTSARKGNIMRRVVLALWLSAGVWTGCGTVQKESRLVLRQGTAQACARHPWLCAGYDSQDAWRRALEAARTAEAAQALLNPSVEEPGLLDQSITVFASTDAEETIKRLDEHIHKVEDVCPSGNPDPNEPKHRDVNHWKKEIRAFLKNLQQLLKRMPNNKSKRQPVEEAIRRGEDALARWSRS
ncbi:hypothetical protein [Archangium gephyra]|uniref:hypothetical protein n=1 Tax=Archangium gephyra TaxID=48 RepID=UPI0011C11089|nr:hypothetical protein [Archangium gephyra]